MRTFVSIELPDNIKENVEKVINELKGSMETVNWVEKKNLHITLKFLGWIDDGKIGTLEDCVRDCVKGREDFDLEFTGIGGFPNLKSPRVLWIGTGKGSERVKGLADCIEGAASKAGFREEERDFSSHLTFGRIKEKIDVAPLESFVSKNKDMFFGSVKVDHVSIMKSTLRRTGPIYEELKQISF